MPLAGSIGLAPPALSLSLSIFPPSRRGPLTAGGFPHSSPFLPGFSSPPLLSRPPHPGLSHVCPPAAAWALSSQPHRPAAPASLPCVLGQVRLTRVPGALDFLGLTQEMGGGGRPRGRPPHDVGGGEGRKGEAFPGTWPLLFESPSLQEGQHLLLSTPGLHCLPGCTELEKDEGWGSGPPGTGSTTSEPRSSHCLLVGGVGGRRGMQAAAFLLLRWHLGAKRAARAPGRALGLAHFLCHRGGIPESHPSSASPPAPPPPPRQPGEAGQLQPWGGQAQLPFQHCPSPLCGLGKVTTSL